MLLAYTVTIRHCLEQAVTILSVVNLAVYCGWCYVVLATLVAMFGVILTANTESLTHELLNANAGSDRTAKQSSNKRLQAGHTEISLLYAQTLSSASGRMLYIAFELRYLCKVSSVAKMTCLAALI